VENAVEKTKAKKFANRLGIIARKLTGEMGTTAAFTAAIAGAAYLNSPAGKETMNRLYKVVI
jgi:hypothetical protein